MVLKAPNTDQSESMTTLFSGRPHHLSNMIEWLEACREATITNVKNSDAPMKEIGRLEAIDDILAAISRYK